MTKEEEPRKRADATEERMVPGEGEMLLRMGVEICGRTDSVEVEVGCPSSFPSPDRVKPQICRYANYNRVRRFSWWTVEAIRYNLALTKASEGEGKTGNGNVISRMIPPVEYNYQNVWAGPFSLCYLSRYATTLKALRPHSPALGSQVRYLHFSCLEALAIL